MKSIIITGLNGQLGQYLVKYLQKEQPDLQVIGTLRHKTARKETYIFDTSKVIFELMDLSDSNSINELIIKYKPDYFINTGANAFVGESWKLPLQHLEINTIGVLHQLEAIRKHSLNTRYINLGSSEEFADAQYTPQDEKHPIAPKSPYACSKAAARMLIKVYRDSYSLYCLQSICFNFESPLRDFKYLPKKVSMGVARIVKAIEKSESFEPIKLGNLNSSRSFQHAYDVADGLWKMLNQEVYNKNLYWTKEGAIDAYTPLPKIIKEYVLSGSGSQTVKELVNLAFKKAKVEGYWAGEGKDEKFYIADYILDMIDMKSKVLVEIDPQFLRPNDVCNLNGDASLAKKELGWEPQISVDKLVEEMVNYDLHEIGSKTNHLSANHPQPNP